MPKALKYRKNDTGFTRHFTPAAQEWHNSVCSYNYTYYKSLPTADKTLYSLLKIYFNLHFRPKLKKVIKKNIKNNDKKVKRVLGVKSMSLRYKKLSVYKSFIGKGNIKHTSNKVILTFYVYDIEKHILEAKIKYYERLYKNMTELAQFFYFQRFNIWRWWPTLHFGGGDLKKYLANSHYQYLFSKSADLSLNELQGLSGYLPPLNPKIKAYCEQMFKWHSFVETMPLTKKESKKKWIILDDIRVNFALMFRMVPDILKTPFLLKKEGRKAFLMENILVHKKIKLQKGYIRKLVFFIEKLYAKKVELNVVNLKYMHFNSDIFTQVISLKLKNRDNKLYRVLKASMRFVKLWPIDKLVEKQKKRDKDSVHTNKIRNKLISFMFTDQVCNNPLNILSWWTDSKLKDPLSCLLGEFFPPVVGREGKDILISPHNASAELTESLMIKEVNNCFLFPLKDYVLSTLKHSRLRGIRVEAKGRLTKRHTASRSVFKMKWIGGLKNVDSSFRGFSAIMLRGHVNSNVQYSIINSKNRNGAYGVKSWVSSR